MMLSIKRILIFTLLFGLLGSLTFYSTESLFVNLPNDEDLERYIEQREEIEKEYQRIIEQELERDKNFEYNQLWDDSVRHTFEIIFSSDDFQNLIDSMNEYHDLYGTYQSNIYIPVTVIYQADDTLQVIEEVGLRTKGDSTSRRLPIDQFGNIRDFHFMLKFNETFDYDESSERYTELKTREAMGVERINFKYNSQNDPSHMNEIFSYHLLKSADVVVPNASFTEVRIIIDGKVELVSFYNIIEHFDEEFIRRHLQEEPQDEVGDLYKVQRGGTLEQINDINQIGVRNTSMDIRPLYGKETNQDILDYTNLRDFSYGLNFSNPSDRLAFIQDNFEVDSFLKTMAMNVLLGNTDDYRTNGNNFYYYFDELNQMIFLPYNYENTLGSGWKGEPEFTNNTLDNDIYDWGFHGNGMFDIPLWHNILEHEEYQLAYENYLRVFIESGLFSTETYNQMYQTVEPLYNDIFSFSNESNYFINAKSYVVLEQLNTYQNEEE